MTLRSLLGLSPRRRHRIPDGVRVYAIGDVHGRADLLRPMLGWIRDDSLARAGEPDVHVVFLGDLIDRGPGSADVIAMLADGEQAFGERHFIRGNHEQAFAAILNGDMATVPDWLDFGGAATLESYGVDPKAYWRDPDAFHALLLEAIPPSHVGFVERMEDWVQVGDYLFVHAGIRPRRPLDQQSPQDLRWIRGDFLRSRVDHGVMVVHGHTISEAVDYRPNRIGIDTGAYRTGHLTVLGLEDARRWTLTSRTSER